MDPSIHPSIHRFPPHPNVVRYALGHGFLGIPGTSEGGTVQLKADAVMDQHPIKRK